MELVVTTDRWNNDPLSRSTYDHLTGESLQSILEDAIVYYDFPAYADYEAANWRPDLLIFAPRIGLIGVRHFDPNIFERSTEGLADIDTSLGEFESSLYSKLIKSRILRSSRREIKIPIHSVIVVSNIDGSVDYQTEGIESHLCTSLSALSSFLSGAVREEFAEQTCQEVRSVIEGAKALSRPSVRSITEPAKRPAGAALAKVERDIVNFDERQRKIALVDVGGPARIRGLAGSGKTIILAMKAAHYHLNNPDAIILFTYYTKSLRGTIKVLISRFYRQYSDQDPDWKKVHIRHGWGGKIPGVYSDTCGRLGIPPLSFSQAQKRSAVGKSPFEVCCSDLLQRAEVTPYYDHVLIDEGQDFPESFYRLALSLTRGPRDRKSLIWAYDELQDILKVKIRPPSELFGVDDRGEPLVDLDRSSRHVPPGSTNDAVLSKAYRTQRDVLVCAHAIGFGVYGQIVQMLESKEHWEDVGYDVETGPLVTGREVQITRPDRNSPIEIESVPDMPIILAKYFEDFETEVEWICEQIRKALSLGLEPEDIIVISLDDRNAKAYLSAISECLALNDIRSNNIIADPYNEPPFTITGRVTLSTVYRAKGNEAALVLAVGVDALPTRTRNARNRLFTAFTRSKAWLRISGIGNGQLPIMAEIQKAYSKSPSMQFKMPDLDEIETIQRGFSKKAAAAKAARKKFVEMLRASGFSEEEIDEELQSGALGTE